MFSSCQSITIIPDYLRRFSIYSSTNAAVLNLCKAAIPIASLYFILCITSFVIKICELNNIMNPNPSICLHFPMTYPVLFQPSLIKHNNIYLPAVLLAFLQISINISMCFFNLIHSTLQYHITILPPHLSRFHLFFFPFPE